MNLDVKKIHEMLVIGVDLVIKFFVAIKIGYIIIIPFKSGYYSGYFPLVKMYGKG